MEFTLLENALIQGIFTHGSLHSKLPPKLLSLRTRQKGSTHSPRQHCFENLFFPTAESAGGNYDFSYENMKMTWNIRVFIFRMTCNF